MAHLVRLEISTNVSEFGNERRYSKRLPVKELKKKLELITGVVCTWMDLELYNHDDILMHKLEDDKTLGSYSPANNWRIHVINKSPNQIDFHDFTKAEKYDMSQDEYIKKEDSVRTFLMKNKLGVYAERRTKIKLFMRWRASREREKGQLLNIGDRCVTRVPNQPKRTGTIEYIGKGETEFKYGCWVGVRYDEPVGKHDGSFKGHSYFSCPVGHGAFVRPTQVDIYNGDS